MEPHCGYLRNIPWNSKEVVNVTAFVDGLTANMTKIAYSSSGINKNTNTYVPKGLETCTHVFINDMARIHSLQQPYHGPFKVIERNEKFFKFLIKNEKQNVSVDRLKSAALEEKNLEIIPRSAVPTDMALGKVVPPQKDTVR